MNNRWLWNSHQRHKFLRAFHDIARFEHFTDLNLFKCAFSLLRCHSKLGNRCFTTLYESLKVVEINSCLQVVIHVHIYIYIYIYIYISESPKKPLD